jgi:hypothetical protein
MGRLVVALLVALAVGGLGVTYIWTSINDIVLGDAGWYRGLSIIPVVLALLILLRYMIRFVNRIEVPK